MLQREVGGFSNERFIEIVGSFYDYCYMGGFDVDPSLLSIMEMFIKEKCNRALCIRKGWHFFTSSYSKSL